MPIGVGLIGCGGISRAHAQGYKTLSHLFRVVAVADVNEQLAQERASELGAEKVFTDYRQLLELPEVEAVDIVLPHYLHHPVALESASAGKHIFVEKPIANTLEQADEMIQSAEKAGVKLMVGFNERFDPTYQKMKELVDEGAIGEVFAVRADHNQNVRRPRDHWLYSNAKAGGGVVIGSGIHRLDLLRWIVGEVKRVANFQKTAVLPMEGEDSAVTLLEFEKGAIGEVCHIWAVRRSPWYEMLYLYGTEGSLHNIGGVYLDSQKRPECDQGFTKIEVPPAHSFTEELRHFGECILNDKEPLTNGRDARKTLEVVIAAYRSAQEGRVVTLPLS